MSAAPPAPLPWRKRIFIFLRSSVVGLAATASDLGSLALMVRVFGWSPAAANVPSLALGLVLIFLGNKYFAFGDRSTKLARQGGLFLLIEIVAIGLNILLFHLLVTLTPLEGYPEVARVIGTGVTYLGFSYPLWCRFVFRYQAPEQATPEPEGPPLATQLPLPGALPIPTEESVEDASRP